MRMSDGWALPAQPVDPPTLAMTFSVNDSPLAGTEGDKVTTRMIRARLMREGEGNVAIRVADTENADQDANYFRSGHALLGQIEMRDHQTKDRKS